MHIFGSRAWNPDEWEIVQSLGEDLTAKHQFRRGDYDGQRPLARISGDADCLRAGSKIDDAAEDCELFDGYPLECWVPLPTPTQPPAINTLRNFLRASSYNSCSVQRLWARIIDWQYANSATQITDTLTTFIEEPATIKVHPANGNLPGIVTVVTANWAIACLDGTRNFTQLATQGWQGIEPPKLVSWFRSLQLWYDASQYLYDTLDADGVTDARPIFLVGHSYGGAVASIMAARFRFPSATRIIKFLTFGCPKIGNQILVDTLATCDGLSIKNDNDPVTIIPPNLHVLGPLRGLFDDDDVIAMTTWQAPPSGIVQYGDGGLSRMDEPQADFGVLLSMAEHVIDNLDITDLVGHGIAEYARRIQLRCPDPEFPICSPISKIWDEAVITDSLVGLGGGNAVAGTSPLGLGGTIQLPSWLGLGDLAARAHHYTSPGVATWYAPAGVEWVLVFCTGAGAKGGRCLSTDSDGSGGGGGGSMGRGFLAVTPGNLYSVTVGDGSSNVLADRASKVIGDAGTVTAGGGVRGENSSPGSGAGGAGGTASSSGTVGHFAGHNGGAGGAGDPSNPYTGAGGGAAGWYAAGGDGETPAGGGGGGTAPIAGGPGAGSEYGSGTGNDGYFPGGGACGTIIDTLPPDYVGADGEVYVCWVGPDDTPPSHLLLEDGTDLLLEDGTLILME